MSNPLGLRMVVLAPLACSVAGLARAQCPEWSDEFARAGVNSTVNSLLEFDDGSGPALYVGGAFTRAGSVLAPRIARWDGASWSAVTIIEPRPAGACPCRRGR